MTISNNPACFQGFGFDTCTVSVGQLSTLNLTNAVKLSTAGANGSEYPHLAVVATGTTTGTTQARLLYTSDGTNNVGLISSISVAAFTTTAVGAFVQNSFPNIDGSTLTEFSPFRIPASAVIYAAIATNQAGGLCFTAIRKDL